MSNFVRLTICISPAHYEYIVKNEISPSKLIRRLLDDELKSKGVQ